MKRHISLYFGSIDLKACFRLLYYVFFNFFYDKKKIKNKLINEIKKRYSHSVEVYPFTSARGAIYAFLKAIINNNDEVILSSYTCLAVPTAILSSKAKPIYIDINLNNLNIDINNITEIKN